MSQLYEADFNYIGPPENYQDLNIVTNIVNNGRDFDNPGWEASGFEICDFPSAVEDWSDEATIQSVHYPEVAALAKKMTGCDHALVGSHILRNPEQAAIHEDLAPIQFVHSDFAETYGDLMRAYYAMDNEEARISLEGANVTPKEVAAASRMVILQFWRNVGPQKMDLPIAFCDARTVAKTDVVSLPVEDYAGGGFNFDTLGINPASNHTWYSFPDMAIDEAVAFRTYDSALAGTDRPFWTPHSAHRDPDVALGAPARYSIELRATCLFR